MHSYIQFLSDLITGVIGLATLTAVSVLGYWYFSDKRSGDPMRKNYPVVGHIRGLVIKMGEYIRTWILTPDREERPFNRVEKDWVKLAASGKDPLSSFGSTAQGKVITFLPAAYPTLTEDASSPQEKTIGEHTENPYTTRCLFGISGMSYGALNHRAILALGLGAKKAGAWLNTGEGGVSKYHLESGADLIVQIGTAKYGVRTEQGNLSDTHLKRLAAHPQVKMFEIKLSQGAKPGKGGILPGVKVTDSIAEIRGIPAGKDSISPNRHPDIANDDELLAMVKHIRKVTGKPCGFKFVMGNPLWFSNLLDKVVPENGPDFVVIDGGEGGTGAAPQVLQDHVGMPLEKSLPEVFAALQMHNLDGVIEVIASGRLITPERVSWALAQGADFVATARGVMLALGCLQTLKCNEGNCPAGIATHDPKLMKGLDVEEAAERVYNYLVRVEKEVATIAHSCGVSEPRQLETKHLLKSIGASHA